MQANKMIFPRKNMGFDRLKLKHTPNLINLTVQLCNLKEML